jgi:kinetochore protein NDC80
MRPYRDTAGGQRSRPGLLQRQNSFLSPIGGGNMNTNTNVNTNTNMNMNNRRLSSSARASLVRSPERGGGGDNKDKKRRRLSLLPSNGHLGAPRLLNQPNLRRQSLLHSQQNGNSNGAISGTGTVSNNGNTSANVTSTPSAFRNTISSSTGQTIQQLVQGSINRSNLPVRRSTTIDSRRDSTLPPSSSSGNNAPNGAAPISTNRLYAYTKPQDPRPIRSHRFQAKIQDELYGFLSTNKFDIEMKQPLTAKTLKNPTQKEFILIFQWLYRKIDPGYKFNRSVEQDIYTLLKFLDYPFLDTINKSQISAVGGSNWPVFLGMLHWLLDLVRESMKFDEIDIETIQESQQPLDDDDDDLDLNANDSVLQNEQSILNKLFINYALKSYKSFLSFGDDDYSSFYEEMQVEYKNYMDDIQRKYDFNFELNENLQESLNTLKEKYNIFFDELERANALKTDVTKFKNYIEVQKQRQLKWPGIIEKAKSDIDNIKESIKNINKEKQEIISDLEKKHLTLKDIEDLHKERARLTASLNSIDDKQKQNNQTIDEKMNEVNAQFAELQSRINQYNTCIYEILNNLNLTAQLDNTALVIKTISDEFKNSKLGMQPNEIIPNLANLKTALLDLKTQIISDSAKFQDNILQSQETLDDLKLTIVSYTDKLEELEDSLTKSRKEYTELNEKYTTDSSNKQIEFEEKAKEIRLFKSQSSEYKKSVDANWKETQTLFKKTVSAISERRTQLVYDIAQSLDSVVNFKSDIMTDLENTVVDVNQELKEQIGSMEP